MTKYQNNSDGSKFATGLAATLDKDLDPMLLYVCLRIDMQSDFMFLRIMRND